MNIILNITGIILETIYYSFFMKYVKNDGKISKYFGAFLIVSIIGIFLGNNNLFSYLLLILLMIYSMKYIVKVKVSLFDMLIIFCMLLVKILIELSFAFLIYLVVRNPYVIANLLGIIKIICVLPLKKEMHNIYKTLEKQWSENRFFIRYIFSVFMFIYVIISCLFLILNF